MRLAVCNPDQIPTLSAGNGDLTRYFIRKAPLSQTDIPGSALPWRCCPAGGFGKPDGLLRASGLKASTLERLCAMSWYGPGSKMGKLCADSTP